ncbi:MAG: DapH/DapD/GlmU-related protein [Imperialibacter sp.]|uniref:acyltransferase n=1 Tax=Imperialibacter sp. TaxID=2038411 RepID=UPI0032ECC5FB
MKFSNIILGKDVEIDPSSNFNNVDIGDNTRIAKRCSIFGSPDFILEIGKECYVGMNTTIDGYLEKVTIGANVSIAQNVHIMSASGPNASKAFQRIFPIERIPVIIGNHCWIGASSVVMPGVELGKFCIVGVNSFVTKSFPDYSIIGGSPAKLIRTLTDEEISKLHE